jgi:hypothetical protein
MVSPDCKFLNIDSSSLDFGLEMSDYALSIYRVLLILVDLYFNSRIVCGKFSICLYDFD